MATARYMELPYAETFAEAALPGRELPWLEGLRREAIERFRETGLPTPRVEALAIALALREQGPGPDGALVVESYREGVVGAALAEALHQLGVRRPVCGDSAYVLSISADRRHRESAQAWFASNPDARAAASQLLH